MEHARRGSGAVAGGGRIRRVRFEVLEAFHIAFQNLTPRTGTSSRERVRRVDQRSENSLGTDFFMMCRDRIHDLGGFAVLARDLAPDDGMRPLEVDETAHIDRCIADRNPSRHQPARTATQIDEIVMRGGDGAGRSGKELQLLRHRQ